MTDTHATDGSLLPDSERLTKLGRFLRSSSLDEFPEFFNVLIGEMSLVGPRPLLMKYLKLYNLEQARRHDVLPGITGWAQVNGRNALEWDDKFRLDIWYVDHWNFWLDIKILFMTVSKVFKREGISQVGHATAEEFMGNEEIIK
jgi:sugar transferase EpsL